MFSEGKREWMLLFCHAVRGTYHIHRILYIQSFKGMGKKTHGKVPCQGSEEELLVCEKITPEKVMVCLPAAKGPKLMIGAR
jgi:hypothetical protein